MSKLRRNSNVNWPRVIANGRKHGLTANEAVQLKKEQLRDDLLDELEYRCMTKIEREAHDNL